MLTSLNKKNYYGGDSLDKSKGREARNQLDFENTPGRKSQVNKTTNHYSMSPNKVMSAKTFDSK